MLVVAWPGYGAEEEDPEEESYPTDPYTGVPYGLFNAFSRPICPGGSACLPAHVCPTQNIHYTANVPSVKRGKVSCRTLGGWLGWLSYCVRLGVLKRTYKVACVEDSF